MGESGHFGGLSDSPELLLNVCNTGVGNEARGFLGGCRGGDVEIVLSRGLEGRVINVVVRYFATR